MAVRGDDVELQRVIDTSHPRLVGLLRLRGCSAEEADDLAQEVLLRLVVQWSKPAPIDNWWAWLVVVACNLHTSRWRRLATRARRHHLVTRADEHHDPDAVAALDLLRRLPDRQRTAVVLRYYAGLSVRETAEAMGVAEGTVKSLSATGLATARRHAHEADSVGQVEPPPRDRTGTDRSPTPIEAVPTTTVPTVETDEVMP